MIKEAVNITLSKTGLDIVLKLKIAPEIEAFFKSASGNSFEHSEKWLDESGSGLKFYKKAEKMARRVNGMEVIDNFGNGLNEQGRINIALLRTVGASEGDGITIKTEDLLSYEEMKDYIEQLAVWSKGFYESTLRPAEINGRIAFDV